MASYEALKKALASGSLDSQLGAAKGKAKKGGGGFFSEKWQPPHRTDDQNPAAEPIALIRGDYTIKAQTKDGTDIEFDYPFWIYFDHYNGSKGVKRRSCSCSAGLVVDLDEDGQPQFSTGSNPCVPCYYIDEEGADDYINRGRKVVFTGVVLRWFHVRQENKKTVFELCEGKKCALCQQGVKKQFGRRVFWSMGPVWAEYIFQKNALFAKSCGCGGEISIIGFTCPKCSGVIRDYGDDTPNPDELERLKTTEIKCPKCGERVKAKTELECSENCNSPRTVDLWSVALKPLRIGDKYTPDLEGWRPLNEKEIEAMKQYKPIDFSKFLSPASLKKQAEWYGLKNPFKDSDSDSDDDDGDESDSTGSEEW